MRGSSCWCVRFRTKFFYSSPLFFYGRRPGQPSSSSLARRGLRPLRVRLRGRPELRKAPWLLLWSRGEMAGQRRLAVTGPSVTQCVVSLLAVTQCFHPKRCLCIICPVGQRPWWPEVLMVSFVRRTPLVGAWTSWRPRMSSLLRAWGGVGPRRQDYLVWIVGFSPRVRSLRSSTRSLQSDTPVDFVFLVLVPCQVSVFGIIAESFYVRKRAVMLIGDRLTPDGACRRVGLATSRST